MPRSRAVTFLNGWYCPLLSAIEQSACIRYSRNVEGTSQQIAGDRGKEGVCDSKYLEKQTGEDRNMQYDVG
jgi:hypothetical protein